MNKNIQQLIKESNGFWERGDYGFSSTVCFSEKDVVKFIENIVKECGNIADEFRDEHLPTLPSQRMRETFGIE